MAVRFKVTQPVAVALGLLPPAALLHLQLYRTPEHAVSSLMGVFLPSVLPAASRGFSLLAAAPPLPSATADDATLYAAPKGPEQANPLPTLIGVVVERCALPKLAHSGPSPLTRRAPPQYRRSRHSLRRRLVPRKTGNRRRKGKKGINPHPAATTSSSPRD